MDKKTLILLVDESPTTLEAIKHALLGEKYEFKNVTTYSNTLNFLKTEKPDLILLDTISSENNAHELCKNIKNEIKTKDIPILFLTGEKDDETIAKSFEKGASDYIPKSCSPIELRTKVTTHIQLNLLKQSTIIDNLTNVFNHKYLNERLEQEINKVLRHNFFLSIIMFDIDLFKMINDAHGHEVGDSILTSVADEVKNCLRTEDIFGRYGSDEFLIILPHTDLKSACILCERITTHLNKISFYKEKIEITINAGIYTWQNDLNANSMVTKADKLKNKAKSQEGCRIEAE
ncbi:MAG: diguanylate cyclase [bacterium]|nr:diguanylate cyclase [bacterium]